jgi:hypothetical protein
MADEHRFIVRFPAALFEELRERAEAEDRSLNRTILRAIRQYLRQPIR